MKYIVLLILIFSFSVCVEAKVNDSATSLDGRWVVFVKYIKPYLWTSETGWFPSNCDEIWLRDSSNGRERCIIKNNYDQVSQNNDWDNYLGSFDSLYFSPDGKKIYFLCQNSTANALLYMANRDGGNIKRIGYAHQLDMISGGPDDKYYGFLVVGERRQPEGVTPIDWVMVLRDPEGNEVKEIEDIERFWEAHQRF